MNYKIPSRGASLSIGQPSTFIIMCAVCKRQVERAEQWRKFSTRHTTFEVYCHGAKEIVHLKDEDLQDSLSISVGEAFTTKAIT